MVGSRAQACSFSLGKLGNSPNDRASRVRFLHGRITSLSAQALSWAVSLRSHAQEHQTVKSAPLHDALRAALDLIDNQCDGPRIQTRPLWHCIAAVGAADAKLMDPSAVAPVQLEAQDEYITAVEAYRAAKTSMQQLEPGN